VDLYEFKWHRDRLSRLINAKQNKSGKKEKWKAKTDNISKGCRHYILITVIYFLSGIDFIWWCG